MKIFRCNNCGNIVIKLHDGIGKMVCCDKEMEELIPGNDGDDEYHIPVLSFTPLSLKVTVSEKPHPMSNVHYIEFIILETDQGFYVHYPMRFEKAETNFKINKKENIQNVYVYCNIHGLRKLPVKQ